MWDAHRSRFDVLQSAYATQLVEDSELMRSVLGVERLSLSLWLSDGASRLVRWAADDRLYRDADALRVVETGHDSPWVAGRALSTETLLIQDVERAGTRRWRSVAAVSIPIDHPTHPQMSAAVVTGSETRGASGCRRPPSARQVYHRGKGSEEDGEIHEFVPEPGGRRVPSGGYVPQRDHRSLRVRRGHRGPTSDLGVRTAGFHAT